MKDKKESATYFKGGDRFFSQMKEAGNVDDNFITNIVKMFLAESGTTLKELESAVQLKNIKQIKAKVHKLKSGLYMFDLFAEQEMASAIEQSEEVNEEQALELVAKCRAKFKLLEQKYLT